MHPITKKRWRERLSWLAMVCLVVPLIKRVALFKLRTSVGLKNTTEEQVANYLRLEYGEDAADPESLQVSDLTYLGQFDINGYATDYWLYPTSDNTPAYATMTHRDGVTELSMTEEPPPVSV